MTETPVDDSADTPPTAAHTQPADPEFEVVLPWWQHPVNIITMLVATALLAGMIGWLVHEEVGTDDGGEVSIGFLHDMRWHHEQAVAMSGIYLDSPGTDPNLRTIARTIAVGQAQEVGRMIQQLRAFDAPEARDLDEPTMRWMGMEGSPDTMPGMATDEQLDALAAAEGAAADALFVELMTAHHLGGIDMADYAAEHAESGEVRGMASSMATSQREEIAEMEGQLRG